MSAMIFIQYSLIICLILPILLHSILKKLTKESAAAAAALTLPPSPRGGLPLLGHIHHLAPIPFKGFHNISSKYGPLLHLYLGWHPILLVSSAKTASEIFKTNDINFASRIKSPFEDSLLFGSSTSFFNAPYGDYWKFMKRLSVQELLGVKQIKRTRSLRRDELFRFLRRVLEKAEKNEVVDVTGEILTLANNSTCRMVMSARCSGEDNEAEQCRELVTKSFDVASRLAFAKLFGPVGRFCIWVFQNRIMEVPRRYDELFEKIMQEHEERAKKEGIDRENKDLMDILLEVYHDKDADVKITRKQMKTYFLDLFTGGTSTTADGIVWVVANLINRPEVFKKVRQEIETVVGKHRLVDESDILNLPYFQAVVKETQRLFPPVPIFDRICRETCKISGYDIPKGITVVMNGYSIMRDPEVWENPEEFRPERFLQGSDSNLEKNSSLVTFGGGRRMCPGTNLTSSLIHGTVAAMVQCFDWKVEGGVEGKVNMQPRRIITMGLANPVLLRPVVYFNPFE